MRADDVRPERLVLVIGNARSGTTVVGSILDSHQAILCANETRASNNFWRGLNRQDIVTEIVENSRAHYDSGRVWTGYQYRIDTPDKELSSIRVLGDKVWNPALLLMAGQRDLLSGLSATMDCPVVLVHCVRNPFDVIATMHRRSGASLLDRLRWYTMHCEAVQMLIERGEPVFLLRHEELVGAPAAVASELFMWLGQEVDEEHLDRIKGVVFRDPRRTRQEVEWEPGLVRSVERLVERFAFLSGYGLDTD